MTERLFQISFDTQKYKRDHFDDCLQRVRQDSEKSGLYAKYIFAQVIPESEIEDDPECEQKYKSAYEGSFFKFYSQFFGCGLVRGLPNRLRADNIICSI